MPCIIKQRQRPNENIWEAYCGKTVFFHDKPYRDPEAAKISGKPICKKCKRLSGLTETT